MLQLLQNLEETKSLSRLKAKALERARRQNPPVQGKHAHLLGHISQDGKATSHAKGKSQMKEAMVITM